MAVNELSCYHNLLQQFVPRSYPVSSLLYCKCVVIQEMVLMCYMDNL